MRAWATETVPAWKSTLSNPGRRTRHGRGRTWPQYPVDLRPILEGTRVTPAPTVFARDDEMRLLHPRRLTS